MRGQGNLKNTPCWHCKNAVPDMEGKRGCSWSRKLTPVEGWTAVETSIVSSKNNNEIVRSGSYRVIDCPEFIRG